MQEWYPVAVHVTTRMNYAYSIPPRMLTSMFAAGKTEREYNLYLCLIFPYKISAQWFLEKLPETGSH